jgi:hypothetical protein
MYDYWLGGNDHYPVDREEADKLTAKLPEIPTIARANRAYLGRVVGHLAAVHGVRQFLDIGSGLPTRNNVHQVAQAVDPECRVVYVDHDPIVVRHARTLLGDRHGGRVAVLNYDARNVRELLTDPGLNNVLDLSRPVAVLMVAVLHFVPLQVPEIRERIIAPLAARLAGRSNLVITHVVADDRAALAEVTAKYASSSSLAPPARTPGDVAEMIAPPWEVCEPGLVPVQEWEGIGPSDRRSPAREEGTVWFASAVARLRGR